MTGRQLKVCLSAAQWICRSLISTLKRSMFASTRPNCSERCSGIPLLNDCRLQVSPANLRSQIRIGPRQLLADSCFESASTNADCCTFLRRWRRGTSPNGDDGVHGKCPAREIVFRICLTCTQWQTRSSLHPGLGVFTPPPW